MAKQSLPDKPMNDSSKDFEVIYETNRPLIYRFMSWRTSDDLLAQDLTSSVFEKAWRTRKSFSGGSSKAWLYQIARTTLVDHWRRKKDVLDDDSAHRAISDRPEMDVWFDQRLEIEKLHSALLKLPSQMNEVIRLRFIDGMSARQTAVRLGISEANVRVIQYRALKKLRSFLQ